MRIAIKKVGEDLQILETTEKYQRKCVKSFLGENRCPEFVYLNNNKTLSVGVTEDGLLRNLPLNFYMSVNNSYFPVQKMVGTVVFTRVKPLNYDGEEIWDYEIEDLTDKDLELIEKILNDMTQTFLESNFRNIDPRTPIGFIPVKFEVMYKLESNLAMVIYQMVSAASHNGQEEFYMPLFYINTTYECDKKEGNIPNEALCDTLKNVCEEISKKANISLKHVKTDSSKVYFSLEETVILRK